MKNENIDKFIFSGNFLIFKIFRCEYDGDDDNDDDDDYAMAPIILMRMITMAMTLKYEDVFRNTFKVWAVPR